MKLTNTLSRKKEALKLLKAGHVSLYVCGPTVYQRAHIGNLRAYITADTLRRVLARHGHTVAAVMNITDVDDKTVALAQKHRAKSKGEIDIKTSLLEATANVTTEFIADATAVGVDIERFELKKATDNIEAMQELVRAIVANGFGYVSEGSVYFDIAAYTKADHTYGRLSNVDFKPRARIDNDEYDKQEARDFVLWRRTGKGEPSWEFELDGRALPGRPGWHIECSAMSAKYLGQPFDIHTGGVDLIFPHHENEIAQSTAATGKPLANVFMHNNHILVDGVKMSKSKGNVYTLSQITHGICDPLALRVLYLQASYRSEVNFTQDSFIAAQLFLDELYHWADLRFQPSPLGGKPVMTPRSLEEMLERVYAALEDDLNTAGALSEIAGQIRFMNSHDLPAELTEQFHATLIKLDEVLGLKLSQRQDITAAQKKLIVERGHLRSNNDFEGGDKLRNRLLSQGVHLDDTPYGPRWRRVKP